MTATGLLVPACTSDTETRQPVETDDPGEYEPTRQALQEILDRRAQAQLAGDERAYLADLDQNNDELIRRERMVFQNLRQFPIEELRFLVTSSPGFEMELPPPPPTEGQDHREWDRWRPSGPWWFVPVVKVILLDTDEAPDGVVGPGETYEYELARRNGGWMIADIRPFSREELLDRQDSRWNDQMRGIASPRRYPSALVPWNLEPLQVAHTGNIWLAADDSVSDLDTYLRAAGDEVAYVEEVWGDRPAFRGHLLFLTRDEEAMARWFELGEEFVGRFAGVAVPRFGVRESDGQSYGDQFASARMVINLRQAEAYSREPEAIMRHELVHAVTTRMKDVELRYPSRWVIEGFARHIEVRSDPEQQRTDSQWAAQGFDGTLPGSNGFYDADDTAVFTNYARSSLVFRLAESLSGLDAAVELYAQMISRPGLPVEYATAQEVLSDHGQAELDDICRGAVGLDAASFFEQWRGLVSRGA